MKTLDRLLDAQAQAKLTPKTFSVPDYEDLTPNGYVKVCRNDERFWLHVLEIDGLLIRGAVANELIGNPDLQLGQVIQVEWRHVYQIAEA
jgi:hypothetical protein